MDCSICSTFPLIIRPPRNTICGACYEGIKTAMNLISSFEEDNSKGKIIGDDSRVLSPAAIPTKTSSFPPPGVSSTPSKGLTELSDWIKLMKNVKDNLVEKVNFLSRTLVAFKDELHTDIKIKPRDGPYISAHKGILASRSEVFKNLLDSDTCKLSPNDDTITIPDLTYEQLESLLEFLYTGSLPIEKMEQQVYSLTLAADKYEILYLQKHCEQHMLMSMNVSNVLDVLEISDISSNERLKDTCVSFIVKNIDEIVFTTKYEEFCLKNPHLGLQITRASLIDVKGQKKGDSC